MVTVLMAIVTRDDDDRHVGSARPNRSHFQRRTSSTVMLATTATVDQPEVDAERQTDQQARCRPVRFARRRVTTIIASRLRITTSSTADNGITS